MKTGYEYHLEVAREPIRLPSVELFHTCCNRPIKSPQPLTSHAIPIAIQIAVPLPQQLLGPGKRADLLAGGLGPAGLDCLRASDGRA